MPDSLDGRIINDIIEREGGYVNNPADRGGPTKYGITHQTLASWRGVDRVTAAQVELMTKDEARAIYRQRYLVGPGLWHLNSPELRAVAVDCFVTHKPKVAIRMLQEAVGTRTDGILGPVTIAAANQMNGKRAAILMCCARFRFFGRLISGDLTDADHDGIPDNTEFAAGWINRTADLLQSLV